MYVTDQNGERIACKHPGEKRILDSTLGENASDELIRQRTGFSSDCVCVDCLSQFRLDLKRDIRICEQCVSMAEQNPRRGGWAHYRPEKGCNVKTVLELIDQPCPKCKEGKIRRIDTGTVC